MAVLHDALGLVHPVEHLVGDDRAVFCQRQIALFEEPHQVIDRMLTLVDEGGTTGQEVLDRLGAVRANGMVDQRLDVVDAGDDLGAFGHCRSSFRCRLGRRRHDGYHHLLRSHVVGQVDRLAMLEDFFLGHAFAHDRLDDGCLAFFRDDDLVGVRLAAEEALHLVLGELEETGQARGLLLEGGVDAEAFERDDSGITPSSDRDDDVEQITKAMIALFQNDLVAVLKIEDGLLLVGNCRHDADFCGSFHGFPQNFNALMIEVSMKTFT